MKEKNKKETRYNFAFLINLLQRKVVSLKIFLKLMLDLNEGRSPVAGVQIKVSELYLSQTILSGTSNIF